MTLYIDNCGPVTDVSLLGVSGLISLVLPSENLGEREVKTHQKQDLENKGVLLVEL